MPKGPEQRLYKPIMDALRARGASVLKIHGGPSQPIAVDFLICYKGLFIAIEVKTPQNPNPTDIQQDYLDSVERAGGASYVVFSKAEALESLDHADTRLARRAHS